MSWTFLITTLSFINSSSFKKVKIADADKYVHFTFYFVLTIVLFLNFQGIKKTRVTIILLSSFIAILYGIIIEVLQGVLTTTRQFEVLDILANSSGSVTAVVCIFFLFKIFKF